MFLGAALASITPAARHCDGLDGPVVKAAQSALDSGKVETILAWVSEKDEVETRAAFEETLAVRKTGREARKLADRYFFETVVRLHRTGEGAPYTGLKSAGRDLGPAIPAADKAIAEGSADALSKLLVEAVQKGLHEKFSEVLKNRKYDTTDVHAGRRYVRSYVEFVHYVERLHASATHEAGGHFTESEGREGHH